MCCETGGAGGGEETQTQPRQVQPGGQLVTQEDLGGHWEHIEWNTGSGALANARHFTGDDEKI